MFAIRSPKVFYDQLELANGKNKIFSSGFMWLIGIIASTLFAAGISGIPMLLTSAFWVIYIFANTVGGSGTFATYQSTIATMSLNDPFGYMIQLYLLPWFHLATGQVSTLIMAIFK